MSNKREKARSHNEKVLLIRERHTSNERAEEERAQQEISQKHTTAEERQAQFMASITEKAKEHNLMALTRAQKFLEEEQRKLDEKKSAI
jgi:hypothetical protein